jgi:hypothetical protein
MLKGARRAQKRPSAVPEHHANFFLDIRLMMIKLHLI